MDLLPTVAWARVEDQSANDAHEVGTREGQDNIYLLALFIIDLHLRDGDGAIGIFVTVDGPSPQAVIAISCT